MCWRVLRKAAQPVLESIWGGAVAFAARETLLSRVSVFQSLSKGDIRLLATQLEQVTVAEQGALVVREGDAGDCMFVVQRGCLQVYTQAAGLVAQLDQDSYFGELAVLTGEARKATIRTSQEEGSDDVVMLRLDRVDVQRLLTTTQRDEALAIGQGKYSKMATLKSAPEWVTVVEKFWALMVSVSKSLAGSESAGSGMVTREGYIQLHLRTSKAMSATFSIDDAQDSANDDWCEDITAFSGDSTASVWLEEVKKKLKRAAERSFSREDSDVKGWPELFREYDADGSGCIDYSEFNKAVRSPSCGINRAVLSDDELRKMFDAIDADGSGEMDLQEFTDFVESEPFAADMTMDVFSEALFQLANLWVAKVSRRFRLIPLQYCLFTPELQWQSRGQWRILQGCKLETPGPGRWDPVRRVSDVDLRGNHVCGWEDARPGHRGGRDELHSAADRGRAKQG